MAPRPDAAWQPSPVRPLGRFDIYLAIAVFVGHRAARVLDPETTKKIASVIFAIVGVAFLAGWL